MENILVVASNLFAIFPITSFYSSDRYIEVVAIAMAMLSSMFYHLIETHKHNMPGMPFLRSVRDHTIFINVDRICTVTAIVVVLSMNYHKISAVIVILSCIALLALGLSEKCDVDRETYIVLHASWHVLAFVTATLIASP